MGRIAAATLIPEFAGRSLDRGRYRLLENIGTGAYGKVYRAIDTSHQPSKQQVFAIKCLNKPRPGSHAYLLQKRELEHHKLVSGHPNIVTFHRCFSDGLFVYVVLDFCNGGDLFTAITEKHLFHGNERLIKSAFVQLIDAVAHCHKLGVYHRDIKPENVLCSDDGNDIRLSDFGLSIRSPYSVEFGCGSSYYMSPECIGGQVRDREYATSYNDIWALGVILTNMITGRNPWRYATMEDECFAAFMNDKDFLKHALPISDGVNDILRDIFVTNPARRLSLANLRTKILALDSFYTLATDFASEKEVPFPYSDSRNAGSRQSDIDGEGPQVSSVSDFKARTPQLEPSVFVSSPEASVVPMHIHGQSDPSLVFNDAFKSAGSLAVPYSDSSGSSAPESKGPITPTTRAVDVDPPVDIPDISGVVLGDAPGLQQSTVVHKPQEVAATAKARRPADIFRAAVQRIKILSKVDPAA